MTFTVALAGNPNSGKSTIFNALTGAHQHVGNWPGKTVEKKVGRCTINGAEFLITDLPGTYSLSAYSLEETIAMDYLVDGHPDVVIVVTDAANLERNLFLAVQIIEMGAPVIVALNMSDIARSRGLRIDKEQLSRGLGGVPVVETAARQGQGVEELKACILDVARHVGQEQHALPSA
jgi:ferrous iron transport protein B